MRSTAGPHRGPAAFACPDREDFIYMTQPQAQTAGAGTEGGEPDSAGAGRRGRRPRDPEGLGGSRRTARPADRADPRVHLLHHAVGSLPGSGELLADHPAGDGDRHPGHRPDADHPHGRHRPVVRHGDGARLDRDDQAGRRLRRAGGPGDPARHRDLHGRRLRQRRARGGPGDAAVHRDARYLQHLPRADAHLLQGRDDLEPPQRHDEAGRDVQDRRHGGHLRIAGDAWRCSG